MSRSGRRKGSSLDPLTVASLTEVLAELGVRDQDWDLVIIGDGSGSDKTRACGWSSVLIDRRRRIKRKVFSGAFSLGSVSIAELMPTLQTLLWFEENHGERTRKDLGRAVRVHVITDSRITASQGNHSVARRCNNHLWFLLDTLIASGYVLAWHWLGRDRTGLSILTDHLSRLSRRHIEEVQLPPGTDVEQLNPSLLYPDFQSPPSSLPPTQP